MPFSCLILFDESSSSLSSHLRFNPLEVDVDDDDGSTLSVDNEDDEETVGGFVLKAVVSPRVVGVAGVVGLGCVGRVRLESIYMLARMDPIK